MVRKKRWVVPVEEPWPTYRERLWRLWEEEFRRLLPEGENWSCDGHESYAEGLTPREAALRIYPPR